MSRSKNLKIFSLIKDDFQSVLHTLESLFAFLFCFM